MTQSIFYAALLSCPKRCGIVLCLLLAALPSTAATCLQIRAQSDSWVSGRVNALVIAAHAAFEKDAAIPAYRRLLRDINETILRCELANDKEVAGRYPKFLEYLATLSWDRRGDHKLGFNVPDKVYFAETRQYVEIPDFLLTPKFLRAVSRLETLNQAKIFLQQLNATRAPDDRLIFFSYQSRHLGTPDNDSSYWRLLIVVPGNAAQGVAEKWVQFGVPDPRARAPVRNVSVVAAVPAPNGTTNVYFKDNFRTYRRDGSITIKGRWELGYGDDNCVECHKSGILPVFPESGTVTREEQPALDAVNQRFLTYIRPRFDRYFDVTKLGPGLGTSSPEMLERRFGPGFDKSTIGNAMTCGACHQSNRLNALNWPMDRVLISSFVRGGQMPFGYKLQEVERNELYRKLIQDYFAVDEDNPGVLKSWLLGRR
jgi:hypothetical protein